MLTTQEQTRIAQWNKSLSGTEIIRFKRTDNENSRLFNDFCKALSNWAPRLKIEKEDGTGQSPPEIRIGSNIRYQAIPTGLELEPFLKAVSALSLNPSLAR